VRRRDGAVMRWGERGAWDEHAETEQLRATRWSIASGCMVGKGMVVVVSVVEGDGDGDGDGDGEGDGEAHSPTLGCRRARRQQTEHVMFAHVQTGSLWL
jgi:hypothetical protein